MSNSRWEASGDSDDVKAFFAAICRINQYMIFHGVETDDMKIPWSNSRPLGRADTPPRGHPSPL